MNQIFEDSKKTKNKKKQKQKKTKQTNKKKTNKQTKTKQKQKQKNKKQNKKQKTKTYRNNLVRLISKEHFKMAAKSLELGKSHFFAAYCWFI